MKDILLLEMLVRSAIKIAELGAVIEENSAIINEGNPQAAHLSRYPRELYECVSRLNRKYDTDLVLVFFRKHLGEKYFDGYFSRN